jgi:hypothetical protein
VKEETDGPFKKGFHPCRYPGAYVNFGPLLSGGCLIRKGNLSGAFSSHDKRISRTLDLAQITAHAVFRICNECLPCQLLKDIHRTDIITPTAVRAPFFPDLFYTHGITSMCGCLPFLF